MKMKIHLKIGVQEAIEKMCIALEKDGFVFAENDRTYDVQYTRQGIKKVVSCSVFWSRKRLEEPYKPTYSIVIQGEVKKNGNDTVLEAEIIEYHNNREHFYAGTEAVEQYFDKLCRVYTLV